MQIYELSKSLKYSLDKIFLSSVFMKRQKLSMFSFLLSLDWKFVKEFFFLPGMLCRAKVLNSYEKNFITILFVSESFQGGNF